MKFLAVLTFLLFANGSYKKIKFYNFSHSGHFFTHAAFLASPITSRVFGNSDPFAVITENVNIDNSKHRWSLIPDSEGRMHLVDLNPLDLESVEPRSVPENDVVFILNTRSNPTVGQIITNTLTSIQNSNFNPNNPTRVTIHGWLGTSGSEVNVGVNAAYFQLGDYNVRR